MYELAKRMWDYGHNALKTEGSDEKLLANELVEASSAYLKRLRQ